MSISCRLPRLLKSSSSFFSISQTDYQDGQRAHAAASLGSVTARQPRRPARRRRRRHPSRGRQVAVGDPLGSSRLGGFYWMRRPAAGRATMKWNTAFARSFDDCDIHSQRAERERERERAPDRTGEIARLMTEKLHRRHDRNINPLLPLFPVRKSQQRLLFFVTSSCSSRLLLSACCSSSRLLLLLLPVSEGKLAWNCFSFFSNALGSVSVRCYGTAKLLY